MSRHDRKKRIPKVPPYEVAFNNVDRLEKSMMSYLERDFTAVDVWEWLYPLHVLHACREAHKYAYYHIDVNPTTVISEVGKVQFIPNQTSLQGIACPKPSLLEVQRTEKGPVILDTLLQMKEIHEQYNSVRDVLTWFKDNGSLSAAHTMCPALAPLFPPEHEFHRTSEEHGRVKKSFGPMVQKARQAATTIGEGLMFHQERSTSGFEHFGIKFLSDDRESQEFPVI